MSSLLDFYGPFAADSTKDALDAVKSLAPNPRYCRPTDEPVDLEKTGARLYVLGPPPDAIQLTAE